MNVPIVGINGASSTVKHSVRTKISSRFNASNAIIKCLVLDKITGNHFLISFNNKSNLRIPPHLKLADPNFEITSKSTCCIKYRTN